MSTPKVAVIIPFFQRESGILATALRSIVAQQYPSGSLRIVIVDDGSPVPPAHDLAQVPLPASLHVDIIRQKNAGPNEARNAGLETLGSDVDVIAYLDSDDEWIGNHLSRAVGAIASGYTAYFSNLYHLGDTTPEFEKAKRVRIDEHGIVGGDPTLRAYQGDMMSQIAIANIIFMPTLAVDAKALGEVRFPHGHRHGGGDYLYWMALVEHGARFAFSTLSEVRCGRGINMWYGSGWGTDGWAHRLRDEARFRTTALEHYVIAPAARAAVRERLVALQSGMVQDVIHRLRRKQPVNWSLVRQFFKETPLSFRSIREIAGHFGRRAFSRTD